MTRRQQHHVGAEASLLHQDGISRHRPPYDTARSLTADPWAIGPTTETRLYPAVLRADQAPRGAPGVQHCCRAVCSIISRLTQWRVGCHPSNTTKREREREREKSTHGTMLTHEASRNYRAHRSLALPPTCAKGKGPRLIYIERQRRCSETGLSRRFTPTDSTCLLSTPPRVARSVFIFE